MTNKSLLAVGIVTTIIGFVLVMTVQPVREFMEFFIEGILDLEFAVVMAALLLLVFGPIVIFAALLPSSKESQKHHSWNAGRITVDEYPEDGVLFADFGDGRSLKFKRNPETGYYDLVGELYPNNQGLIVSSLD